MGLDASELAGMGNVDTAGEGENGGGSIQEITSTGASVTITNPTGPVVNIEVAANQAAIFADSVNVNVGGIKLSAVASAPYTEGTLAWVRSVGDYFALRLSALTVDHLTVETALGKAGYQWVRLGIVNRVWAIQAAWSINTTTGSDEAIGDAGHPLLTYAELSRRLVSAEIRQTTTITVTGNQATTDQPIWTFTCNDDTTFTGKVLFQGTRTQIATGTVTTWTAGAAGPSVDNGDTIVDNGLAVSFTASGMLANAVLGHRTSAGATRYWWFAKDLGTKTARLSRPQNGATGLPSEGTLANGDTYEALTIPTLGRHRFTQGQAQTSIVFQFFNVTAPLSFSRPGIITYANCWFATANAIYPPGVFQGCAWSSQTTIRAWSGASTLLIRAGCMIRGTSLIVSGLTDFTIDGRVVIQGVGANASLTVNGNGALVWNTGGLAAYDTNGSFLTANYWSMIFFAADAIAGNGNTGANAITVNKWSQLTYLAAALALAGTFTNGTPISTPPANVAVAGLPVNQLANTGTGVYRTA